MTTNDESIFQQKKKITVTDLLHNVYIAVGYPLTMFWTMMDHVYNGGSISL